MPAERSTNAGRRNGSVRHASCAAAVCASIALASLAGCSRDTGGPALTPCRLKGLEIAIVCSTIEVAEDRDARSPPDAPGRRIPIRFAVIPALAPHPERDAVFVLAGGPGQAATDVAGQVYPLFSKLNQERDIVLVDQRGTGQSHPLSCRTEFQGEGFADTFDPTRFERLVAACAKRLSADADLTRYTTSTAVRDLDDVRARLGYATVDLWGASYGTRVALEYLRQFPERVRTMTLDGVAPPWQKLPLSFGVDTDATLVARLVAACAPRCDLQRDCVSRRSAADLDDAPSRRLGPDGAVDVETRSTR